MQLKEWIAGEWGPTGAKETCWETSDSYRGRMRVTWARLMVVATWRSRLQFETCTNYNNHTNNHSIYRHR